MRKDKSIRTQEYLAHVLNIVTNLSITAGTSSLNRTKTKKRTWMISKAPTSSSRTRPFTFHFLRVMLGGRTSRGGAASSWVNESKWYYQGSRYNIGSLGVICTHAVLVPISAIRRFSCSVEILGWIRNPKSFTQ